MVGAAVMGGSMTSALKKNVKAVLAQSREVTQPSNLHTLLDTIVSTAVDCGIDEGDIKQMLEKVLWDRAVARGAKLTIDQQLDLIEQDWPGFRSFVGQYYPNGILGVNFRNRIRVMLPHGPAIYEDLYEDGRFRFMCHDGTNRQFPDLISVVDFVEQYTGRVL